MTSEKATAMSREEEKATTRTESGSIRVKILKATRLPNMDFGCPQNPFALVRFEHSTETCGRTDAIYDGGQNPHWTDDDNRDFELYWNGSEPTILQVEIWNEGQEDDDLIGVGTIDVNKVTTYRSSGPLGYTVTLREAKNGTEQRGQVHMSVSFGPPIRLAIRAAQKATKLLDVRDSFVGSLCSTKRQVSSAIYQATSKPREFADSHKKLCLGTASALFIGFISMTVIIAVPLGFITLITLPIWFIPAMMTSFATAPIWVPTLTIAIMLMAIFLLSFIVLALTSRPIRKRGALWSRQLKETTLGRKIIYAENPAESN